MKNISIILYLILFGNFANAKETQKPETVNTFKSKVYGFEFKYPDNWVLSAPPDDDTGRDIPVEDSGALYIDLKYPTKACIKTDDCHMYLSWAGDGTDKGYEKIIKFYERFDKNEVGRSNKFVTTELNGNKIELLIRDISISEYGSYIYIYCEKSKRIAHINVGQRYNSEVKNYAELKNRPITLENLFEEQQQEIIKSFKCPDPNFAYTPSKKELKTEAPVETKSPVKEKQLKTKIDSKENGNQVLKSEVKHDLEPFKYKSYDDPQTGIKFVYPEQYTIINGTIMKTPGKYMFWYIYDYSFDGSEKELKSIGESFGIGMGSSDGPSGSTTGIGVYLDTVLSKSQDDIMIFDLIKRGYIDSKKVQESIGYILTVPIKKKGTDKYSALILLAPTKDSVYEIAKSIEIPRNLSAKPR